MKMFKHLNETIKIFDETIENINETLIEVMQNKIDKENSIILKFYVFLLQYIWVNRN